jgi:hypothetical protein
MAGFQVTLYGRIWVTPKAMCAGPLRNHCILHQRFWLPELLCRLHALLC